MHAIVVEDEVRIREGIVKLLRKLRNDIEEIYEATDGEQGLAICREKRPDIIITDIRMSQMDGLEMLTQLDMEGYDINAIVLSAFSEFEYARTAMKLGVSEYLLKPVSVSEFQNALENVVNHLHEKRSKKPSQIGTLEQFFYDVLNCHMEVNEETITYLKDNYHISSDQNFLLLCCYLGESYEEMASTRKQDVIHALSRYKGISYATVDSRYHQSIVFVIYQYSDAHDMERWLQYQLLENREMDIALGCIEAKGVNAIEGAMNQLFPYMDWNISFEQSILIVYPKITQIHTSMCMYPVELEAKGKNALCTKDFGCFQKNISQMQDNFVDGNVYSPKEIKECYIRFLWKMIETAKDISLLQADSIDYQNLMSRISNAKSRQELREVCDLLVGEITAERQQAKEVTDLTVLRMKSMIDEFYNTGITLDEIAERMNMTPEYLGTKFHRELGVSFKAYIKEVRINKAKELLRSTPLKLYEIAEKVGYTDSKYFSKVFKETTGQLPADYRKTSK